LQQPIKNNNYKLDLIKEAHQFGDGRIIIERVRNLDNLIDQVSDDQFNVDERLPYWAELWPSAIALSRFVANNSDLVKSKTTLELGCGLGLTSISISLQNPSYLLLTDYEQGALDMTMHNFKLNRLPLPDLKQLDWRSPDLDRQFQRIIASDIIYEERFFHPLIEIFQSHLRDDGKIIIAEPNRSVSREFFEMLRNHGYIYSVTNKSVMQNNQNIIVSIYIIEKQKNE
jgi:predicted nicotinamide N-methyase